MTYMRKVKVALAQLENEVDLPLPPSRRHLIMKTCHDHRSYYIL